MAYLLNSGDLEILLSKVSFDWLKNKKILITGASGMLGSYLTESIVRGCEITGVRYKEIVASSKSGNFTNIAHLAEKNKVRFINHETNHENLDEYEVIIHAASPSNPTKFRTMHELSSSNLAFVESSNFSSLENFCFFSTGEIYGLNPDPSTWTAIEAKMDIRELYPRAKLLTEIEISSKFSARDVKISMPRIFHTFGPGLRENDGRSFGDFIYSVSKNKPPSLYSSGNQLRTFLYSLDFAIAILKSMDLSNLGTFDLGSGNLVSIREFAIKVSKAGGLEGNIDEVASQPPGFVHSNNFRLSPDTTYLQEQGWRETSSLDLAIRQTLDWISRKDT